MQSSGISQEALAMSLGCTRGAVGHYLAGRRNPTLKQLEIIAESLQLNPTWMLFGEHPYHNSAETNGESHSERTKHQPILANKSNATTINNNSFTLTACTNDDYILATPGKLFSSQIDADGILLLQKSDDFSPDDKLLILYKNGDKAIKTLVRLHEDEMTLKCTVNQGAQQTRSLAEVDIMYRVLTTFEAATTDSLPT